MSDNCQSLDSKTTQERKRLLKYKKIAFELTKKEHDLDNQEYWNKKIFGLINFIKQHWKWSLFIFFSVCIVLTLHSLEYCKCYGGLSVNSFIEYGFLVFISKVFFLSGWMVAGYQNYYKK